MTGVDVAAIRERCMNDWLRGRGKDLAQAEVDRADMVSLYDELFEVYVAVTARLAEAERQRDDALTRIGEIRETMRREHDLGRISLGGYLILLDRVLIAARAALTDPHPPTATVAHETAQPCVPGTTGPQNRSQGREA